MNINNYHNRLKSQYLSRDYGNGSEINYEQFSYLPEIFPNDAFYAVDCKKALMRKLSSNFDRYLDDNKKLRCAWDDDLFFGKVI